jgi:hypothetical protein
MAALERLSHQHETEYRSDWLGTPTVILVHLIDRVSLCHYVDTIPLLERLCRSDIPGSTGDHECAPPVYCA